MYNKIDLREVPAERLKEISLDLVDIDAQAPEFEPNRQFYFMAKARDYVKRKSAELGRPMTFFTQTFGCAMIKDAATLTAAPNAALTSHPAICPSSSTFMIGSLSQYRYRFLFINSAGVPVMTSVLSALINLQISG